MHKLTLAAGTLAFLALTPVQAAETGSASPSAEAAPPATSAPPPARPQGRGMGPAARGPAKFSDFDLNGDGKITGQEFSEGRARRMAERAQQGGQMRNAANAPAFSAIDTNGDGVITPDEFAAHQPRRPGGR